MNERIAELMSQTGVPVSMPFDKWCDKFAKLIVLECADLIHKKVGAKSALDILDHFGLE
jgi:hypothetical protein